MNFNLENKIYKLKIFNFSLKNKIDLNNKNDDNYINNLNQNLNQNKIQKVKESDGKSIENREQEKSTLKKDEENENHNQKKLASFREIFNYVLPYLKTAKPLLTYSLILTTISKIAVSMVKKNIIKKNKNNNKFL
jgi:hypothetical protein